MAPMDLTKFIEAEKWRRELQSQQLLQDSKNVLCSKGFTADSIKIVASICVPSEIGDQILQQILLQQADCVLIGSRGLGMIRRALLGSLSMYVVQHATVPVIICKTDPFAPPLLLSSSVAASSTTASNKQQQQEEVVPPLTAEEIRVVTARSGEVWCELWMNWEWITKMNGWNWNEIENCNVMYYVHFKYWASFNSASIRSCFSRANSLSSCAIRARNWCTSSTKSNQANQSKSTLIKIDNKSKLDDTRSSGSGERRGCARRSRIVTPRRCDLFRLILFWSIWVIRYSSFYLLL